MTEPSTPAIRFDTAALVIRLNTARRERGLTWRQIGQQAGTGNAIFSRLGAGYDPSAQNLAKLLAWLGETDLAPYMRVTGAITGSFLRRFDEAKP